LGAFLDGQLDRGRVAELSDIILGSGLDSLGDDDLAALCLRENAGLLDCLSLSGGVESGIAVASRAADRIAAIVEAIRSYARELREAASGASASVEDSVGRALSLTADRRRPDVEIELRLDGVPPVAADHASLVQLWSNLIQNALRAMEPGGGKLEISATVEGGFARVDVADDGPGVPPAIRDKLFVPFAASGGIDQGLGLGLSICRRIAESYGGSISYGTSGGRTVFSVRLPLAGG
jgi:C4-dicarboxylate-specific signal transduction histidine kinase